MKISLPMKFVSRISNTGILSILMRFDKEEDVEFYSDIEVQEDYPSIEIKRHTHSKFSLNVSN